MSSFRQLLTELSPALLVDACSAEVQVGWLDQGGDGRWASSDREAGIGVFLCLKELDVDPSAAAAFIFCEGPGSLLGIRTAAMALRAWNVITPKPMFSYRSLELTAHAENEPNLTLIADARRDAWHTVSIGTPLRRVPAAELPANLAMPDGFRNWTPLPSAVRRVSYSLRDNLPLVMDADLLRRTELPDAFLHEEPVYVAWSPRIHRAP